MCREVCSLYRGRHLVVSAPACLATAVVPRHSPSSCLTNHGAVVSGWCGVTNYLLSLFYFPDHICWVHVCLPPPHPGLGTGVGESIRILSIFKPFSIFTYYLYTSLQRHVHGLCTYCPCMYLSEVYLKGLLLNLISILQSITGSTSQCPGRVSMPSISLNKFYRVTWLLIFRI